MSRRTVAILGMGAIGTAIVESWKVHPPHASLVCICARPNRHGVVRDIVGPETFVTSNIEDMMAIAPDIIVEAAGHAGALSVAEAALSAGSDFYLLSVGILADPGVRHRLIAASQAGGGKIVIPAGALAGFDGLAALARLPRTQVKYTSIKPCAAWKSTPAENLIDLDRLEGAVTFFRGSATDAALLYPKNANLAAAVALAGIGFEDTVVELVADSNCVGNRGIIEASNGFASLTLEVSGVAAAENPKTSAIVSESILSAINNASGLICFR